eukprot:CAMPEP_0195069712 /NCGR_PEP_ID=MMETSP0448-20130528/13951_1 /TAXON_ID=66468 /ORGANISM="Heterocapsa triquestra, Strain CCMP 448" /LENGTH=267 /DNA_ID=CAMNT_0040101347 /DNA_START=1 /DNA_END=800 /DNA_ORIENTATION=+
MWGRVTSAAQAAKGAVRKPRKELENQLKEATGPENWGVGNSVLQGIAAATQDQNDCEFVIQYVFDVLKEKNDKKWRRIQKSLTLIEALLKYGSDYAIDSIRRELWRIQQWREHRVMEAGKDVGSGIRFKAQSIVEMCNDSQMLQQERDKAQNLSTKMSGIGAVEPERDPRRAQAVAGVFKAPFDRVRGQRRAKNWEEGGGTPSSHDFSPNGRQPPGPAEKGTMVQQFCQVTGCAEMIARDTLERTHWDMNEAFNRYFNDKGRGDGSG